MQSSNSLHHPNRLARRQSHRLTASTINSRRGKLVRTSLRCTVSLLVTMLLSACSTAPALAGNRSVRSGNYSVEILVNGQPTTTYRHRRKNYVAGGVGSRYEIRINNDTNTRVEAVISIDGRDAIDGKPASMAKRGYLVDAYGSITIDGFRTSLSHVAAFRFSSVSNSYANRMGDATDVGVIGVALFPEGRSRTPLVMRERQEAPPSRRQPKTSQAPANDFGGAVGSAEVESAPAPSAESGTGRASRSRPPVQDMGQSYERPGLGTAFGETRHSPVQEVAFVRQNKNRPQSTISIRYDDWEGLMAAGVVPRRDRRREEARRRQEADPFPADNRFSAPPP